MNTIIPVASGKGGVGKTVLCANIGLALAAKDKATVLVDLDLGGSNLHTMLGVNNRQDGIGDLVYSKDREMTVGSLVIPTAFDRLFLVPGDCLVPGTANLPSFRKKKLQSDLHSLVSDFVIVDLSSGSSYNTVDFFLMAKAGLVVVTPETTSILNAYSFLKTAVWRLLYRSYPAKSEQRDLIDQFMTGRIEKNARPVQSLIERIAEIDEASASYAEEQLREFTPRIVINEGRYEEDLRIAAKLREVVARNLGIHVEYIGFVPYDSRVPLSVIRRRPAYGMKNGGRFRRGLDEIASRLISAPGGKDPALFDDDQDLESLRREARISAPRSKRAT